MDIFSRTGTTLGEWEQGNYILHDTVSANHPHPMQKISSGAWIIVKREGEWVVWGVKSHILPQHEDRLWIPLRRSESALSDNYTEDVLSYAVI